MTGPAGWRFRSRRPAMPPGSAASSPSPNSSSTPATRASASVGVGLGLVIAANRTRPPWEAMTLARLAARYAGRGVVGFGLSNDERQGRSRRLRPCLRHRPGRGAALGAACRRVAGRRQRPARRGRSGSPPDRSRRPGRREHVHDAPARRAWNRARGMPEQQRRHAGRAACGGRTAAGAARCGGQLHPRGR